MQKFGQHSVAMAAALALAFGTSFAEPGSAARFRDDPEGTPGFVLPDLLVASDGRRIESVEAWERVRRPELLELFRTHVYGRVPATEFRQEARLDREDPAAMDGKATLQEWTITISTGHGTLSFPLVLFLPNAAKAPAPAFLLLCNRARNQVDPTRVVRSGFWPAEEGIARGFAMAAFLTNDVQRDRADQASAGIRGVMGTPAGGDSWGALAAWAWGASRCLDQLQANLRIAGDRVAVVGQSRGGKAALWAGAEDRRFGLVCSNDSGCGGAALSRRRVAGRETLEVINRVFPHWFAPNFHRYVDNEDALPVDQHQLMALIAPRAVAVASASEDLWADPRGEFLSLRGAAPVFRLLGRGHWADDAEMPPLDVALDGDGAHYHIRTGRHDLTLEDWKFYWDFADREWRR